MSESNSQRQIKRIPTAELVGSLLLYYEDIRLFVLNHSRRRRSIAFSKAGILVDLKSVASEDEIRKLLQNIVWRQVDATQGRFMRTGENQWNANARSDGCFVECRLMDANM
jgi:hypothetical protein